MGDVGKTSVRPERYSTTPETVEGFQVGNSLEALEAAARWCGGRVVGDESTLEETMVQVPTIEGMIDVRPGEYLVKDLATGQIRGYEKMGFEARFHKVGVRGSTPPPVTHLSRHKAPGFTDQA